MTFILSSLQGLKKDPGIPNLFPYKEQLLKQLEEKKQQAESDKEKHKLLLRQRQQQSKKKKSLQGLQNDALQRTREFEKKVSYWLLQQCILRNCYVLLISHQLASSPVISRERVIVCWSSLAQILLSGISAGSWNGRRNIGSTRCSRPSWYTVCISGAVHTGCRHRQETHPCFE